MRHTTISTRSSTPAASRVRRAAPRPHATARVPEDEARRLAVLAEFAALDTAPEPELDAQVRRLAQVCDAPIALLGLLDVDRQ